MSGGHFDYVQHKVGDVYEEVQQMAKDKGVYSIEWADSSWEYGDRVLQPFQADTVKRLARASEVLLAASKMIQRIDWFLSGDDGEESFNRRWVEEGLDV